MIRPRILGLALGALACVLLAATVAGGCTAVARLGARGDETRAAEWAAAAFIARAGAADPASAATYRTDLAPLTTGPLRAALQGAVVDHDARARGHRTTTHVEAVAVTALGPDVAVVTVAAVQSRTWFDPRSGTRHEHLRQHTTCRLVRVDGRWLVAELQLLSEERLGPDAPR